MFRSWVRIPPSYQINLKMNTEKITSNAILQKPILIKIGNKSYLVPKPTPATLIEMSGYVSKVEIDKNVDINSIEFAIANAHEAIHIANALSVLMIGAKQVKKEKGLFGAYYCLKRKRLVDSILHDLSFQEMFEKIMLILDEMGVGFFLRTITFLNEVNMIKRTKS